MGFSMLLGNRRTKENLIGSLKTGRIAHFYLISGPEGSGKHLLSRLLSAALLCEDTDKPCLSCASCRKVMAGTHPDVITVDDPDKKSVSVSLIRETRDDIYIQPNEANHKIYIFPRGQDMTPEAQNALLKVLEEPPAYGIFMILTDNPEKLLPTVRSRCVELSMMPLDSETLSSALQSKYPNHDKETIQMAISRCGGFLGQAIHILENNENITSETKAFANAFAKKNVIGIMTVLVSMEKWKREALIQELSSWISLLESALSYRCAGVTVTSAARILGEMRRAQDFTQAISILEKAIYYAKSNVSPAAVCGYLQWALRI